MSWRDILTLLEFAGGDESKIDSAHLEAATAKGAGEPDVQMRIAKHYYKQKHRKGADNGQTKWEFA
jgi:hypothetical protein